MLKEKASKPESHTFGTLSDEQVYAPYERCFQIHDKPGDETTSSLKQLLSKRNFCALLAHMITVIHPKIQATA